MKISKPGFPWMAMAQGSGKTPECFPIFLGEALEGTLAKSAQPGILEMDWLLSYAGLEWASIFPEKHLK